VAAVVVVDVVLGVGVAVVVRVRVRVLSVVVTRGRSACAEVARLAANGRRDGGDHLVVVGADD
jgi:hypothetical protein